MKRVDELQYLRVVPVKQAVEEDLLALQGVTGVGVGYKQVGGEETDVMAIRVFVARKGEFPEGEQIPAEMEGVPTDVIEAVFRPDGEVAEDLGPAVDPTRYATIPGGCSGGPARLGGTGTLGLLVKDSTSGAQRMLSNWHVLCWDAKWDQPGVDRTVTQPGRSDGGTAPADAIGNVVKGVLGQVVVPWSYGLYVDCALCDLSGARPATPNVTMVGAVRGLNKSPIIGELVRKYGRTTGLTYGVVNDTNFTVNNMYYRGIDKYVTLYYQFLIVPPAPTMPPFSQSGDSGAVVVDSENYAIGLNFGSSTDGSYALSNPIFMVMQALGISLISTEEDR